MGKGSASGEAVAAGWHDRVIGRSMERTAESLRARGLGPARRIVDAALAISAESDGAAFSIQDVVARADVAVQTFYRHFGSKDALLVAMLEEGLRASVSRIAEKAAEAPGPVEAVRTIVLDPILGFDEDRSPLSIAVVREHWKLMEAFPKEVEHCNSLYRDVLQGAIERAVDAGLAKSDSPLDDADLITQLLLTTYHRMRLGALADAPNVIADRTWSFCRRALSIADA